MSFYEWQGSDLLLKIHVQTRAKDNAVTGLHDGMLKLRINAVPVDNKTNKCIIAYFASEFSVKQSAIKLISGLKHRNKQILIKQAIKTPTWFDNLSDSV